MQTATLQVNGGVTKKVLRPGKARGAGPRLVPFYNNTDKRQRLGVAVDIGQPTPPSASTQPPVIAVA